MEVVVVLPWLPATATPYLSRISSASISARGMTGMPEPPRLEHLGVVAAHRGGGDDHLGALHVRGGVALRDPRPELREAVGDGRALEVGAGDRVAEVQQHLGDAAHPRAADAHEVHALDLPEHDAAPNDRSHRGTEAQRQNRECVGPLSPMALAFVAVRRGLQGSATRRGVGPSAHARRHRARIVRAVPAMARASDSPVRSFSSIIRAAPAASRARAFTRWWSSAARAKGTSTAALPAAGSSAQVVAPLRATTRSAAAKRASMSSRKATTSASPARRA